MNVLVLLTNSFPFGNASSFIQNEMEYYDRFDKVLIYPLFPRGDFINELPANVHYRQLKKHGCKLGLILESIPRFFTLRIFYQEMLFLFKQRKFKVNNVYAALLMLARSLFYSRYILEDLKRSGFLGGNGNIYLYGYWMKECALTSVLLSKKTHFDKVMTRAHGHDIYEERNVNNYLPFRRVIFSSVDYVVPISQNGVDYLKRKYSIGNIRLSRLGTKDWGTQEFSNQDIKTFTICSCSFCRPIKRVHLIIEALKNIKDIQICWTHIGGDGDFEEICKQALNLGDNIVYHFMGNMPNKDIMQFYRRSYIDVFVNVSSSEGIPVSIMEAMSFGIPTIATNVGGISEIVENGSNGYLLSKDFKISELSTLIRQIALMTKENQAKLRNSARLTWERKYSASKNYPDFINTILQD